MFINSNIILKIAIVFFLCRVHSEFHIADVQKKVDEDMNQNTSPNTLALYFKGLFLYKYNERNI